MNPASCHFSNSARCVGNQFLQRSSLILGHRGRWIGFVLGAIRGLGHLHLMWEECLRWISFLRRLFCSRVEHSRNFQIGAQPLVCKWLDKLLFMPSRAHICTLLLSSCMKTEEQKSWQGFFWNRRMGSAHTWRVMAGVTHQVLMQSTVTIHLC